MNGVGWIFVILTVLAASWGMVRLHYELNRRIALGSFLPRHRLPALGIGLLVAVIFCGVALKIASALVS